MKMRKKQSTLFPQDAVEIVGELPLSEAEIIAAQVKATVEAQCDLIEVAGSVRRQKTKVHDIDFVIVAKSDLDWLKIN
jgi:DNA polymerase/3'-5' exonuclease PolX